MCRLGAFANIFQSPPTNRYQDLANGDAFRLLQSSDLANFRITKLEGEVELVASKVGKYLLKPRDVILTIRSERPRASVYCLKEPGITTQNMCVIRVHSALNPFYLAALFRTDYGRQILKPLQHGALRRVTRVNDLRNLEVPVPTTKVQKRLVMLYDALERANETARERLQARHERVEDAFASSLKEGLDYAGQ